MDFAELIETLSKGSATAVTTLESNVAELNALKEYLYVQTHRFNPQKDTILILDDQISAFNADKILREYVSP